MKLLTTLIPGVAALVLASAAGQTSAAGRLHPHDAPQVSGWTSARYGTAAAVRSQAGLVVLVLRGSSGNLTDLVLGPHHRVTGNDGCVLAATAIRSGDSLVINGRGDVRDTSQQTVTMQGVVSLAPETTGDPLVIQAENSWAIVADFGTQTVYTDRSHETSSVGQLGEGDQVRVTGMYDKAVGEMTQTISVSRLGPLRHKGTSTPGRLG